MVHCGLAWEFLGDGLCFSGSSEDSEEGWGEGAWTPLGEMAYSGILAAGRAGGLQAAPSSGVPVL